MIIAVGRAGEAILDSEDIRRFKVQIDVPRSEFERIRAQVADMITFDAANVAWVSIQALRDWKEQQANPEWRSSLDKMIAGAAPHGWVDSEGKAIKAHVEWSGE